MTITAILVDRSKFEDMGVGQWELNDSPLEMRGLGRVVVLAGPNGGGKSRILRTIKGIMQKQLTQAQITELQRRIRENQRTLEGSLVHLGSLKADKDQASIDQIATGERIVSDIRTSIEMAQRELDASATVTRSCDESQSIVFLVPPTPRLVDTGSSTDNAISGLATQLAQGQGSMGVESSAPAYARQILRAALWAKDRRLEEGRLGKTVEEESAKLLQTMVVEVLGPAFPLELNASLNLSVGGRSDYPSVLSPGQQILFQFVCILHAQGASLSNCVVFMDEPENHLHPAAIAQIVDKLKEKISTGQLWIATHSVPLIAQLVADDADCLWYVANGKAKRAGRTPEIVLDGLMGSPNGARHINELTSLPAQFAALRFLGECLKEPAVVGSTINDPQLTHIGSLLAKRKTDNATDNRPIRILDFGAGKGRLARELSNSKQLHLEYIAYEPSDEVAEQCRQEVLSVSSTRFQGRCFSDLHLMTSTIDAGSVDVIVMCNVLHEISPDEWLKLFGSNGMLTKLLHASGHLLIVEDYGIPSGERAHTYGFLLLDEPELRPLFCVGESAGPEQYVRHASTDPKYKHRLAVHLISQECVARVTPISRHAAIRKLNARTSDAVRHFLQDTAYASEAGRTYALNAQLLANSALWLDTHGR